MKAAFVPQLFFIKITITLICILDSRDYQISTRIIRTENRTKRTEENKQHNHYCKNLREVDFTLPPIAILLIVRCYDVEIPLDRCKN